MSQIRINDALYNFKINLKSNLKEPSVFSEKSWLSGIRLFTFPCNVFTNNYAFSF